MFMLLDVRWLESVDTNTTMSSIQINDEKLVSSSDDFEGAIIWGLKWPFHCISAHKHVGTGSKAGRYLCVTLLGARRVGLKLPHVLPQPVDVVARVVV